MVKVVKIREAVSTDLALRESANLFFDYIEGLPEMELEIDFGDVRSISRSFAHQYCTRKGRSIKSIRNINVPENIKKMFVVVQNPAPKSTFVDLTSIKVAAL